MAFGPVADVPNASEAGSIAGAKAFLHRSHNSFKDL